MTDGLLRVFLLDDHEVVRQGLKALLGAVRTVGRGESLLDPSATGRLLQKMRSDAVRKDPLDVLTDQERKILDLIGEGLTNREIGERMFLAEKTVKNYVSSVLVK